MRPAAALTVAMRCDQLCHRGDGDRATWVVERFGPSTHVAPPHHVTVLSLFSHAKFSPLSRPHLYPHHNYYHKKSVTHPPPLTVSPLHSLYHPSTSAIHFALIRSHLTQSRPSALLRVASASTRPSSARSQEVISTSGVRPQGAETHYQHQAVEATASRWSPPLPGLCQVCR